MRFVMFYHSLVSCWNHGNAHFLRGVASELTARGHTVDIYETADSWSRRNMLADGGDDAVARFRQTYPELRALEYHEAELDLDDVLATADVVIVHEWNSHALVERIGAHRRHAGHYCLLFHDTHHRSVTQPEQMADYDLRYYDGVLAFGRVIRDLYLERGWARHAWTWHEAADTRVFYPRERRELAGDLVWIGNWGDDERSAELAEFLFEPVRRLGLTARIYGVRYPAEAQELLRASGIEYRGWLPNIDAPQTFADFRVTAHVPRRPYVQSLPGIPTIRPFEALACGIPLVSAAWNDAEHLFTPGADYLVAEDGEQMRRQLECVLTDADLAGGLIEHGRGTILARHTCAHRVDELLDILASVGVASSSSESNTRAKEPVCRLA